MTQLAPISVGRRVFKHAMPSCAQPAVLPTDPNCSSALRDSTAAYKKSSMTLFVPVCFCKDGSQPALLNRNPIDLTASAANASGSVQTTLSKLPRRHRPVIPALLLRGSPDRDLSFLTNFRMADNPPPHIAHIDIRIFEQNFDLAMIKNEG